MGETVWFEDFERDNWLAKIMGGRRKFEKTELSFVRAEVRATRLVSRSGASRCVAGAVPAEKLKPVSAVGRFLSTPIVQVSLSSGTSIFFDMIRRAEFIALFPLSGSACASAAMISATFVSNASPVPGPVDAAIRFCSAAM